MALPANRALCQVCAHPLVRNGTTSAGRTRWRCKHCGASTTRTRTEITAAAQMNAFHNWLLGRSTQSAHGGTGRSFRAATAWCWNITVPPIEPTGLIADQVMIDGTYFNGWCVLIAFNTTHVIDWQWCDREKHTAWAQLLARVPAPRLVIVDGGTGIHAALRETWAQTPVQRCYFHILQTVRRHTTYQPRTTPGREILALTRALMRVRTLEQASDWLSEYSQWEHRWDELLKQRSYPRVGAPRPTDVPLTRTWWYTHRRLRRVRGLFRSLIGHENLFTFLDPALTSATGHLLHRTTSPLEGGPNKAIKELLRTHRGMPEAHARTAVDWLLESATEHPRDPWEIARAQLAEPPQPAAPTPEEPVCPALYDLGFSWEDGNGIQHGWGGRSRP